MPDLQEGQSVEVQGSASRPYVLKNVGGVFSCTCPAWRNQSLSIERRSCKHLRQLRGDAAEQSRIGGTLPAVAAVTTVTAVATVKREKPAPPALLLAETWDGALDPQDWWLSEKLDGVRAFWNGKIFLSRQGNRFFAPAWFTAGLPPVPLDGELWLGRRLFQKTVSIVRRQDEPEQWRDVRFLVFDTPDIHAAFEIRQSYLQELMLRFRPASAAAHPQVRCRNVSHLRDELARIVTLGGEGLMLRQTCSPYEPRRSSTLLKVKTFHEAEAHVVGHQPGAGRHKGRLGALLVELPNGIYFAVGSGLTDAQRDNPPPRGSTITFKFQELSDGGVPRFPTFVGVRRDEPHDFHQHNHQQGISHMAATKTKRRRFECTAGTSDKFSEVDVQRGAVTVRFGRNGTAGQSRVKNFVDAATAEKHAEKLIAEKLKKGYRAVG